MYRWVNIFARPVPVYAPVDGYVGVCAYMCVCVYAPVHKYNAVALITTTGCDNYESIAENISIDTFINSFIGYLLGLTDEFK